MASLDLVFGQLERIGLLLETDSQFPSVASLVADSPVKGSWWSHPKGRDIWLATQELADHPDVLTVKLISGKVTFMHRKLWPALLSVATAKEPWQTEGLSPIAKELFSKVTARGQLYISGETVRELEAKILVHSEQVHTASGAHAKRIESWTHWAKRTKVRHRKMTSAEARGCFEEKLESLDRQYAGKHALPWTGYRREKTIRSKALAAAAVLLVLCFLGPSRGISSPIDFDGRNARREALPGTAIGRWDGQGLKLPTVGRSAREDSRATSDMVTVPGGSFTMGCSPSPDAPCQSTTPAHQVRLGPFEIDITEATQQQYQTCIEAHRCTLPNDNFNPVSREQFPVTDINWEQAREFCSWQGKRLPTEAEWELAARGMDDRRFPWGNVAPTCNHANMGGCLEDVDAVGQRPAGASPYGALDMAGNVWEWVNDWYDPDYYRSSPTENPQGPATGAWGNSKSVRGGGFQRNRDGGPNMIWASVRVGFPPAMVYKGLGVRCAR